MLLRNNLLGFALLEKELEVLERKGVVKLPSLNHWLEEHNLYVQKEDIRALRKLLQFRKYKLVRTQDYSIVKRGINK